MFETVVSFCKSKGFVYPSSEIYGGFSATYDYGPLGALMLRNIQDLWLKTFIYTTDNMFLMDGAIISHPKIWEASGHVKQFNDPLVEDKKTHIRYRADKLIEKKLKIDTSNLSFDELNNLIRENNIKSPDGNELTEIKKFNLLVKAEIGSVEGNKNSAYLRGETCQNIFVQYLNILKTVRRKLPFGVGQIGKSFRNEITTKQFILRTREFYQMETEFFVNPKNSMEVLDKWKQKLEHFFIEVLGLSKERLRFREIKGKEKSHYAKKQYDVEYQMADGQWLEITPLNHRGEWDLSRHQEYSGMQMTYKDKDGNSFIPNVIETSIGLDRLFYILLESSYEKDEKRVVLHLKPKISPYKVAVFPLLRNREELVNKAKGIYKKLQESLSIPMIFDDNGNIGKRYRRQDEIGTPFCITVDFDTMKDETVTLRNRDTMKQERVKISVLDKILQRYF